MSHLFLDSVIIFHILGVSSRLSNGFFLKPHGFNHLYILLKLEFVRSFGLHQLYMLPKCKLRQ